MWLPSHHHCFYLPNFKLVVFTSKGALLVFIKDKLFGVYGLFSSCGAFFFTHLDQDSVPASLCLAPIHLLDIFLPLVGGGTHYLSLSLSCCSFLFVCLSDASFRSKGLSAALWVLSRPIFYAGLLVFVVLSISQLDCFWALMTKNPVSCITKKNSILELQVKSVFSVQYKTRVLFLCSIWFAYFFLKNLDLLWLGRNIPAALFCLCSITF